MQLHALVSVWDELAHAGQRVELDGVAAGTDARLGRLLAVLVGSKAALDKQDLRREEGPGSVAGCYKAAKLPCPVRVLTSDM
jgi:hypothetical protein